MLKYLAVKILSQQLLKKLPETGGHQILQMVMHECPPYCPENRTVSGHKAYEILDKYVNTIPANYL